MRSILILLVLASAAAFAEVPEVRVIASPLPAEGHEARPAYLDRALLRAKVYSDKLRAERGFTPQVMDHTVELQWPLRKAITVADPEIQAIGAYLDHDEANGTFQDWDCGQVSYDGHNGTDIGMIPYSWWRMRRDHGIIVAAAPGIVVVKDDTNPEDSCDFNQKDGNVLIIEQDDSSQAIYAHMRTGSLTQKPIGERVEAGDYLGVVGSSGISTGPHLHFGVGFWETEGNVTEFIEQDPWEGACNGVNDDGWWATPPPYLNPAFLSMSTHNNVPLVLDCPESEKPRFKNSFTAGDPIVYLVNLRDQPAGQTGDAVIRQPNGVTLTNFEFGDPDNDVPGGFRWGIQTNLPADAMAGEWEFEATWNGETYTHLFYVDADPPGPNPIDVSNNQFNGLWYDPALDGEGYNIVTTPSGTVIYFYGSDEHGNRLWMISETIKDIFREGKTKVITMYESTGGVFDTPVRSARALSVWGVLRLTFDDCNGGTARLNGIDGLKTSNIIKLAAVPGTTCGNGDRSDRFQSGLWFNPALDGEGFNLIVAPNGVVLYYYGFDKDGNRLWLISAVLPAEIDDGAEHTVTLFKADSGTFDEPVKSSESLEDWGSVTLKVNGCNDMDYEMNINEGDKVTGTVRLAGILGLDCS